MLCEIWSCGIVVVKNVRKVTMLCEMWSCGIAVVKNVRHMQFAVRLLCDVKYENYSMRCQMWWWCKIMCNAMWNVTVV